MALTYREDGPWGGGKGSRLTVLEGDTNIYTLDQRILNLENNPPTARGIADFMVEGRQLTILLDDYSSFGPYSLPVAFWNFKNRYIPNYVYSAMDVFIGPEGTEYETTIYIVSYNHTSAEVFDPMAIVPGAGTVYTPMLDISDIVPTFYSGPGSPGLETEFGVNGDFYIDEANGGFYKKMDDYWIFLFSMMGTNGADGTDGAPGEAGPAGPPGSGTNFFYGSGVPSEYAGNENDLFLDIVSLELWAKQAGEWNVIANLASNSGAPTVSAQDWNTRSHRITDVNTDFALIDAPAGYVVVIGTISAACSATNSVPVNFTIGFGASATPVSSKAGTNGMVLEGKFDENSGIARSPDSVGFIAGKTGEKLFLSNDVPTSGDLVVTYTWRYEEDAALVS